MAGIKVPVIQYDLAGNFIKQHESILAASKATDCSTGSIQICLKGVAGFTKQTRWGYVGQELSELKEPKKRKKNDIPEMAFDDRLVSDEIHLMRLLGKTQLQYEISCYKKSQAEELEKQIPLKLKKWTANWYYNLIEKVYYVICERSN